jgi:hypothetical protein
MKIRSIIQQLQGASGKMPKNVPYNSLAVALCMCITAVKLPPSPSSAPFAGRAIRRTRKRRTASLAAVSSSDHLSSRKDGRP